MNPLAIVGDVLLVVGFALGIAALALVSLPLALGVGGLILFIAGAALTALAAKRPKGVPGASGPFEQGS